MAHEHEYNGKHGYGRRAARKADSATTRANVNRQALEPEPKTKGSSRKRPRPGSRKFGIEFRPKDGKWFFSPDKKDGEWSGHWSGWYETTKRRDQAIVDLNKNSRHFEFRPRDRGQSND